LLNPARATVPDVVISNARATVPVPKTVEPARVTIIGKGAVPFIGRVRSPMRPPQPVVSWGAATPVCHS
jgi:hypothetical protein